MTTGTRYSQSTEPIPHGPLVRLFQSRGQRSELRPKRGFLPKGPHPTACYVEEGWLSRVHDDENGGSSITATYVPGDFINLDTLVEDEPLGRLCALTPCRISTIPVPDLRSALADDPVLALNVIRHVVAEADWLREAVIAMGSLGSREKIIYYFGQMRRRQIAFGTLDRETARYSMPITQRHLAMMVGISVIHANRLTKALRESGLLTLRAKSLTLHDVNAFEKAFAELAPAI